MESFDCETNCEESCPYTTYHQAMGSDINTCRAYKFSFKLPEDEPEIALPIGIPTKVTKMPSLSRAILTINKYIRATINGLIKEVGTGKLKEQSLGALDYTTTQNHDNFVIAKLYTRSIMEIYTNPCVSPHFTQKELTKARNIIADLVHISREPNSRSEYIDMVLNEPVYVLLAHSDEFVKSQLQITIQKVSYEYARETLNYINNILQRAQFKHYCSNIKRVKELNATISQKFNIALDNTNYMTFKSSLIK